MTEPVKNEDGTLRYYDSDKKLHRDDGPAIIWPSGDKEWFVNGIRHRDNGPAVEYATVKIWYLKGKKHREDGPAVQNEDERLSRYYLNDKEVIVKNLTEFIGIVRFKAFI